MASWSPLCSSLLPAFQHDFSAASLTRLTRRIWVLQQQQHRGTAAPDDDPRAEPVLGTHLVLQACLSCRRLSHARVPCSALVRRRVPASVIAVGGAWEGSGGANAGGNKPRRQETVGASSGLPADSLVGSGTFRNHRRDGHAYTSEGGKASYWHNIAVINDRIEWECQQQFDSLGLRSIGAP